MRKASKYAVFLLFVPLVACNKKERDFGQGGGGSGSVSASTGGVGGTGGAGGGVETIDTACDSYAFDVCQRFQQCSPNTVTGNFGDLETCHTRYMLFCKGLLEAQGTGWTPSQMKACGEAYGSLECNLYLAQPFRSNDSQTPAPCVPPQGSIADGAGCIDHGQCQSGHCHRTGFSLCGSCGYPGGAGDPCGASLDCKGGMVCLNGICREAGEVGAACTPGQVPCNFPWPCVNGTCAEPGDLKDTCSVDLPPCNGLKGLYCDGNVDQCVNAVFKQEGEACTIPDTLVLCQGAGVCGQASGICHAPSPEGGVCDPANGPGCMAPAFCFGGKCTIANSTFCP